MRVRSLSIMAVTLGGVLVASQAGSTSLACRKGVTERVYAKTTMQVPRTEAEALHKRLEAWGKQRGMHVGGGGSQARPGEPWKLYTVLQSKRFGVVLDVTTPARGNKATATVENNCWAPQEDWRPHWRALQLKLKDWGYLRAT